MSITLDEAITYHEGLLEDTTSRLKALYCTKMVLAPPEPKATPRRRQRRGSRKGTKATMGTGRGRWERTPEIRAKMSRAAKRAWRRRRQEDGR